MIAQVTGRVVSKGPSSCVLETGGIGLRIFMSTSGLSRLPALGDEATVFTYLHVREDVLSLFGFTSEQEQDLFEKLIAVSGVGPALALAALSAFSPDALAEAIAREDDGLLASVPGIGKKTAQRIIIELKDKLAAPALGPRRSAGGASSEARDALAAMGFAPAEIAAALKGYDGPEDPQALLRYALKRLGGGA